jgi:four helix bundle protein
MRVAQMVYRLTNTFPSEERFGLVPQMRRAVISIPSNIAEGAARQGKREFKNFVSIAQSSLSELDTQLELSVLLGYASREDLEGITTHFVRVDKMLTGLIKSLMKKTDERKLKRSHD